MNNSSCAIVTPTEALASNITATKSYESRVILEGEDFDGALSFSEKISKDENLYQFMLNYNYLQFNIVFIMVYSYAFRLSEIIDRV